VVVRMIHTRLPMVVWAKSFPGTHSSCTITSLSGWARTIGPLKEMACSPLKERTCSPLKARACSPLKARVLVPKGPPL